MNAPDHEAEHKRQAVRLRLEGLRAKEISKRLHSSLGVRYSEWVIRKWIRDSKEVQPTRDRVLALVGSKSVNGIAKMVGVSERRVRAIIQEAQGPARQRNTPDQNVDRFLSNPSEFMKARFTQSPAFGRTLLRRCCAAVDKGPEDGRAILAPSLRLLEYIKDSRLVERARRQATCLFAQGLGIEAHVLSSANLHRSALSKMNTAINEASDCLTCKADQSRRLGVLYSSWKKWDDAHRFLRQAIEIYRDLGTHGHDLYGNGLANCMLLGAEVFYFSVSPQAGACKAREGMSLLTGSEMPALHFYLVFALAKCLQASRDPVEVAESRVLIEWFFKSQDLVGERSTFRTLLLWLRGQLASSQGNTGEAIECFTYALEDAQALEMEQEVPSILADLGAINPDPREIRGHIEDICEWDDYGEMIVPSWINKELGSEILLVYDSSLSCSGDMNRDMFLNLRRAAGGEGIMPALVSPAGGDRRFVGS